MLLALVLILILLWTIGYLPIHIVSIPNIILFSINGHEISLWNIFTLAIILALISILPRPFREIASVLLLLWVLSVLGIFFVAGFSQFFLLAIIIGSIMLLLTGA